MTQFEYICKQVEESKEFNDLLNIKLDHCMALVFDDYTIQPGPDHRLCTLFECSPKNEEIFHEFVGSLLQSIGVDVYSDLKSTEIKSGINYILSVLILSAAFDSLVNKIAPDKKWIGYFTSDKHAFVVVCNNANFEFDFSSYPLNYFADKAITNLGAYTGNIRVTKGKLSIEPGIVVDRITKVEDDGIDQWKASEGSLYTYGKKLSDVINNHKKYKEPKIDTEMEHNNRKKNKETGATRVFPMEF